MNTLLQGLLIDNFAGGGGASTGIECVFGRSVDIAINHDREALSMHAVNHPGSRHFCEDVWAVDPIKVTGGKPVALAWFSPDCKHFSKAKGGKPVEKKIRGLAWVAARWAKAVGPAVIILENVEEFAQWGPLLDDGMPCPERRGLTFRRFVGTLRNLGYDVDWQELVAADFGAPTTRKRLFLIARCDGNPIVWPEPTHDRYGRGGLPKWRAAAECIDWSIPCPSIFERKRPLADNTMRRIARGVMRYVVNCAEPFIVPVSHSGDARVHSLHDPLRTVTGSSRATHALVSPTLIQTGYGERPGQAPRVPGIENPLGTIMGGGGKHAIVAAFLAKHNGIGDKQVVGQDVLRAIDTITATDTKALVTTNLIKLRGTSTAQGVDIPLHTVSAQGTHFAEVRAFLIKFYSEGGQWANVRDPMHTITTKDRMGLATVHGDEYAIVDIGMRMLTPRELFRAQGFPEHYEIEFEIDRTPLTKTAQVRMCGNSVCPPVAEALVRANCIVGARRVAA